eukprot:10504724-Lingulodinium_polyedra.AAC.1
MARARAVMQVWHGSPVVLLPGFLLAWPARACPVPFCGPSPRCHQVSSTVESVPVWKTALAVAACHVACRQLMQRV